MAESADPDAQVAPTVGVWKSALTGRFRKAVQTRRARRRRDLILALDADVDRQLRAAETASAAISTRASILVAAAGLTSGLQVTELSIVPAVLAVLAALVGVALLLMRTADEVPILDAEEEFWNDSPELARHNLMHWKHGVLRDREKSLKRRRLVLVLGFALLAASLSYELIAGIVDLSAGGGE